MEQRPSNFFLRTIGSFRYAFHGLGTFFIKPSNAWVHAGATIIACLAGYYLGLTNHEWIAIVFAIALVFVAEMLNSAIEILTDYVSPDFNEQAGKIKDIAAGAVLFASLAALIIGALVFLPKLL
jgi:diacylglycerol kinase